MSTEAIVSYSFMGAGNALMTRLLQRILPTPLEEEQLRSLKVTEQRARQDLNLRIADFRFRKDSFERQLQANQAAQENIHEQQHWVGDLPPSMIRKASLRHKRNALITLVRSGQGFVAPGTPLAPFERLVMLLAAASSQLQHELVHAYFSNGILYFPELRRQAVNKPYLTGQQIVTALNSQLETSR